MVCLTDGRKLYRHNVSGRDSSWAKWLLGLERSGARGRLHDSSNPQVVEAAAQPPEERPTATPAAARFQVVTREAVLAAREEMERGAITMAALATRIGVSRERVGQLVAELGIKKTTRDPEGRKASQRRYASKPENRDRHNAVVRAYAKRNRDKINAANLVRYRRRKQATTP